MELVKKWDRNIEVGIYKKSKHVKKYSQIRQQADELRRYLDENNGHFDAVSKSAYALSHCQVDTGKDPWHFFVLGYEFIRGKSERSKRDTSKNFYFPSQIIVNAKILEIPEKLDVSKPVRKIVKINGVMTPQVSIVESKEKNLIGVTEACMSFPNRTPRTEERYYRIKVYYQYPVKVLGVWFLRSKTEWAEGLKAHILQHEIQHADGKNMYYDKR